MDAEYVSSETSNPKASNSKKQNPTNSEAILKKKDKGTRQQNSTVALQPRVKETAEDKEVKRIGKILESSLEEGKPLYMLNVPVQIKGITKDALISLSQKLIELNPNTAFILTEYIDSIPEKVKIDAETGDEVVIKAFVDGSLQFVLAISNNHKTMGNDINEIAVKVYDMIVTSPVIHDNLQAHADSTSGRVFYFSKPIKPCDFTGKILDTVSEIVFNYMKLNKYIPQVESDDEDKFANLEDIETFEF